MKPFSIVVAIDEKNGIGKQGALAWHLSADLKHFKEITTTTSDPGKKNVVIMGRKTWDSLPKKFKPLPGRLNVVLTAQKGIVFPNGVLNFSSLVEALQELDHRSDLENIFVIGGAQIFTQALKDPACRDLFVTHLKSDFHCDVFFSPIPASFKLVEELPWANEGDIQYHFSRYQKAKS